MSAALLARPSATGSATVIGETPDILVSILQPAVQLAVWRRPRPVSLEWLDALEWDAIDDIDVAIAGPDFASAIWKHLCDAGYPQSPQGQALCDEVVALAIGFSQVVSCFDLRFRLDVIETDACRTFHMNQVTARLLAPFSGPGTQWIDLDDGEDRPVRQLDCGNVGLFKGRLWVEEPRILHRSPPIAALGKTRLLLVLDPAPRTDGVFHA